jgi:hypothetical protein
MLKELHVRHNNAAVIGSLSTTRFYVLKALQRTYSNYFRNWSLFKTLKKPLRKTQNSSLTSRNEKIKNKRKIRRGGVWYLSGRSPPGTGPQWPGWCLCRECWSRPCQPASQSRFIILSWFPLHRDGQIKIQMMSLSSRRFLHYPYDFQTTQMVSTPSKWFTYVQST